MRIYVTTLMLFFVHKSSNDVVDRVDDVINMVQSISSDNLKFFYLNSNLGKDNIIEIKFGDELSIMQYWIQGSPLKLTTHGWDTSVQNTSKEQLSSIVNLNYAYVDLGGFNIITVDWSLIALDPQYPKPAALTVAVGAVIASFLERVVSITGISPNDVHLIGYSLGAHVVGSCGSHFKQGKFGRITGLDAAGPGFETFDGKVPQLNPDDGQFVDCIHTGGGSFGFTGSLGHADFYPNNGLTPQPGCRSFKKIISTAFVSCSHVRAVELYIDSIVHRKSLIGISCPSWDDFKDDKCKDNPREFMGHDTSTSARGNYYLRTHEKSPFGENE